MSVGAKNGLWAGNMFDTGGVKVGGGGIFGGGVGVLITGGIVGVGEGPGPHEGPSH